MRRGTTLQGRVTTIVAAGVAVSLVVPVAVVVTVVEPASWRDGLFVAAFATAALASVGIAVLIGRAASRAVLVPLEETISRLESLAEGGDATADVPFAVEELDRLRELVNLLVARTAQRERSFAIAVGALAHDARSSLLAVRRALTLVSDGVDGEHASRRGEASVSLPSDIVESMIREVDRVHVLTSDLVMVMRSHAVVDRTGEHSIVQAIHRVVEAVRPLAAVTIDVIETRPFSRPVPAHVLDRVFRNVIENAARAARSRVSIEVLEGLVVVADDGPGIPQHVMATRTTLSGSDERSERVDHGFGMAIAHRLAELAGGKLAIEKSDERGTTVLVYL